MRTILMTCLILLAAVMSAAVEVGTPRVNVLQELGQPTSAVKRGDTEVLSYKDGVRVKLKDGRVVEVTGLKPAVEEAAKPAEPAAVPAAAPVAEEEAEPVLTKEQAAELDKMEKESAAADAKARAELEKAIGAMENPPEQSAVTTATFAIGGFLMELAIKWVLTLAALKLSCKYWNSDVPWNGLMLVSIVDVAVRGVIGYIGYQVLDMMSLLYADEAVAALVMVVMLRKVSINQRLSLAIEVVVTTKTFSIVVGSFVVTVALRMLA